MTTEYAWLDRVLLQGNDRAGSRYTTRELRRDLEASFRVNMMGTARLWHYSKIRARAGQQNRPLDLAAVGLERVDAETENPDENCGQLIAVSGHSLHHEP